MIRLIIFGSRTYNNYPEFEKKMEHYTGHIIEPITLLCGMAKGTDDMGLMYAIKRGWEIEKYPAEWDLYGKSAGYKRNKQMVDAGATHAIGFWDGESPGTKMMIQLCKEKGINLRIVRVHPTPKKEYKQPKGI